MESRVLASALYDREAYETLKKHNIEDSLSDQGIILWKLFAGYYTKDNNAVSIDKQILITQIDRLYPKHSELLTTVINNLEETSSANLIHEIIEQKLEAVKLRLSQAFSSDKNKEIEPLLEQYNALVAGELEAEDTSEILIAPNLKELMEARSTENRIPIYPETLNKQLDGGALRGHHIVVLAPTDMGKTLFSLNVLRGLLLNGYKTLVVGNEDPMSDLVERFLISLTGKDKYTVRSQFSKAQKYAESKNWSNIIWAELSPGTLGEIRSLIETHEPDVLIVDQIRNLDTGEKNHVRGYEKAAQGMRNFAKKYNLVSISITQAGDSATGKVILNRGDIDGSNVGIPGTADLMLGIGATEEQEFDGLRTLSFPKNKISGNKQPIQVSFNTKTMRVE